MEQLYYTKYDQNPSLQLEATMDDHFGIGRPLIAKLPQNLTWTGANVLGVKLGNLRSDFAGEQLVIL